MTLKKLVKIWITIFILIPILFVAYIFYGFVFHEHKEDLNSTSFKEYRVNMKKKYPEIKNLDTYYQFGRITFDFNIKDINEENCYKIIQETKELVIGISDDEFGYNQATIRVTFRYDDNFYEFESPYWIQHSDGDLALPSSENNYKIWYKTINGNSYDHLIFN